MLLYICESLPRLADANIKGIWIDNGSANFSHDLIGPYPAYRNGD